jgi:hypothetical protein
MKFYVEVMTFGACNLGYSEGKFFPREVRQKCPLAVLTYRFKFGLSHCSVFSFTFNGNAEADRS